jgi:3-dehydroquinate synthase
VTDETVAPLYGARSSASFENAGIAATKVTVPAGREQQGASRLSAG